MDNEEKLKEHIIKNKESNKNWRVKNKDKIQSLSKKYYEKNKIKILNYNKNYRINNKEKIKENMKEWQQNNQDKLKLYRKTNYQKNKETIAIYKKEYGKRNKLKLSQYRHERKLKLKQYITEYKTNQGCCKCNENRSECIDFHHLLDKKLSICKMVLQGYSLKVIKEEIEKCILLCSNCHRKEHFKGYKISSKKQRYIFELKTQSKCYFCSENTPCTLAFHHLNPKDKISEINFMEGSAKYSLDDMKNEIKKCIILCFSCHKLLHANKLYLPEDIQGIKIE